MTLSWDQVQQTPVEHFTRLLRQRTPFAFSRWGDGEWRAVLGTVRGQNCDGHAYFADLGRQLRQVLTRRPGYLLGLQHLALRLWPERISEFAAEHRLGPWHNADVFHQALARPQRAAAFRDFLAVLRERFLVVVGPEHLQKPLAELLAYQRFIPVPARDCFTQLERIVAQTLAAASDPAPVISLSCSMPAELVLDRIVSRLPAASVLDMGSVWDPYAGVYSRGYMRGLQQQGWQPPR